MAKIIIDSKKCKGCGYCAVVCPNGALGIAKDVNSIGIKPAIVINPSACIGCSLCAIMCPDVCIKIWK